MPDCKDDLVNLRSFEQSARLWRAALRNQRLEKPSFSDARELTLYPALVVGNGPSLSEDLQQIRPSDYLTRVAVNYLGATPLFEEIRPTHYFMQDDYWFNDIGFNSIKASRTIQGFRSSLDWNMKVIVPQSQVLGAKKLLGDCGERLTVEGMASKHFKFSGERELFQIRDKTKKILFSLLAKKSLSLPAFNIVSTVVFELLQQGYKEIHLIGVDMSMGREISVSETGNMRFNPRHFYDSLGENEKLASAKTVAEAYFEIANKFLLFQLLNEYAATLEASLWNLSSFSFLDSIPRRQQSVENRHE